MGFRGSGVQISASRPPSNSHRRPTGGVVVCSHHRPRWRSGSRVLGRRGATASARAAPASCSRRHSRRWCWLPGGLNLRTLMEGVAATAPLRVAAAATLPDQRVVVRRPPPSPVGLRPPCDPHGYDHTALLRVRAEGPEFATPLRGVQLPTAAGGRTPPTVLSRPATPGLRPPRLRPLTAAGGECRISASRPPSDSQRRPPGVVVVCSTIALARARAHEYSAARRDRERSRRHSRRWWLAPRRFESPDSARLEDRGGRVVIFASARSRSTAFCAFSQNSADVRNVAPSLRAVSADTEVRAFTILLITFTSHPM